MSRPLFFCSSKPASTLAAPGVGQANTISSSPPAAGCAGEGVLLALVAGGAIVPVPRTPLLAAVTGGSAGAAEEADGAADGATATAVLPGGVTRSTCPTSITLGLSRPFQRTMSRQFWP